MLVLFKQTPRRLIRGEFQSEDRKMLCNGKARLSRYTGSMQSARKPERKVEVFVDDKQDQRNSFILSAVRIIVGGSLAVLFILKDLACVILFGVVRLLGETLRWFVNFIIRFTEEILITIVRVTMRSAEELFNLLFGVILQIINNGGRVLVRGLQQIIGVVGYLFIIASFAVAYLFHRIISFLFSER